MTSAQEAQEALAAGEFARAKDIYGSLLEEYPEESDYICGFYTSAYWDNRHSMILEAPPGKARGSALVEAWDQFEALANDKQFSGLSSFRTAMRSILGRAAEEFRLSFQDSGLTHDSRTLAELGRCLIRIEDYANAAEILHFARKVRSTPEVLFLLGEALCASAAGDPETLAKGLSYYRDAFILEPDIIDPSLIASHPASDVFTRVYEEKDQNKELASVWFPAKLMSLAQRLPLRRLLPEEVKEISKDLARLSPDLERVVEKYKERVRARICFFILVLLQHHYLHDYNEEAIQELETRLAELDAHLYKEYRDYLHG
jgi:tetratricopeptide (TPR) repeat protein